MSRWSSLLGVLALLVWILAAIPEITVIHGPVTRESPEQVAAFESRYEHEILPTYRTLGISGAFESAGYQPSENSKERQIQYRVFKRTNYSDVAAERGAIVIAPDHGELSLQYAETIYDLANAGYSVYILDQRGNGTSERLTSDRTVLHVDHFLDYSADFRKFIDEIVRPGSHKDLYLLCHGMGCAATAPFLASNPTIFRAVAMTAPMFELKLSVGERAAAWMEGHHLLPRSLSAEPALGRVPYNYDLAFERNLRTGSWMRFHKERELLLDLEQSAQRIAHRRLPLAISRPSYHWLAETENGLNEIATIELWRSPTLVLEAGQDAEVGASGQEKLCQRLSESGCKLVRYEDAFHDLLQERSPIRASVLGQIRAFFEGHSSLLANKSVQPLDS